MMLIDLTPRERYRVRHLQTWQVAVVALMVAGLAFLVSGSLMLELETRNLAASINTAEDIMVTLRPYEREAVALRSEIGAINREVELLRELLTAGIPWHFVLTEISDTMPRNAWIQGLTASIDGRISISGTTFTHEDAAQVAVALRSSPMFESAEITSSRLAGSEPERASFVITVILADWDWEGEFEWYGD